jgi:hypothetical protein
LKLQGPTFKIGFCGNGGYWYEFNAIENYWENVCLQARGLFGLSKDLSWP